MSFFSEVVKDLANKPEVQKILGDAAESAFKEVFDALETAANRTETDVDNIALKAFLQAAVKKLDDDGVPDIKPEGT